MQILSSQTTRLQLLISKKAGYFYNNQNKKNAINAN